jgi:hypothetical protein
VINLILTKLIPSPPSFLHQSAAPEGPIELLQVSITASHVFPHHLNTSQKESNDNPQQQLEIGDRRFHIQKASEVGYSVVVIEGACFRSLHSPISSGFDFKGKIGGERVRPFLSCWTTESCLQSRS